MSRCRNLQLLSRRDADLLLHDVDAGDELGDRMLDLHPRVHLDEEELVVLVEKLEGTRAAIADLPAGIRATLADPRECARGDPRCWRLLDDLLVPALHRAIAFEQVDGVLVLVGQHLDLDVARIREELLHVERWIAECRLRLTPGERHRRQQGGFGVHDPHAAAAATAGRLDDDGVADSTRSLHDLLVIVGERTFGAGNARHAGLGHRDLGADLVAHQPDRLGARADEHEPRALDLVGEVRVLGEEPIARVNGLRVGHLRRRDDGRHIQVALRAGRRSDADGLVGEAHVLGLAVRLGVDDDSPNVELAARALDAQRNLATIGDQHLPEQRTRSLGGHRLRPETERHRRPVRR